MNAAWEGWKVLSDCGRTWWFSRAASRPVSLSNYIFDVCFFSGFMKSSIVYAVTLRTFVRFETMIWPITELKKSLDIFWLWLERKHSEEYLVILLVVKRKLWAIFLPQDYLEKVANMSKPAQNLSLSLNLQGFILDSGFSETLHSQYMYVFVNKNCCHFKCFIELYFLPWMFVKISCLSLCELLFLVIHEHCMQEYSKCPVYLINMVF